ncbi:hypothetical protein [Pelomonas cellulosilytica]|uniref:Uncharacterized protein n=1 Tax=Pelomonas cellulosilytica TaxID=2906762 RepID=A0ABS8XU11_9BURK|nr:hypothetical protein [Pelomonas sp. P8]MCE4554703.1 hypothetical protein [Pelomonas sp. P8]
MAARVRAPTGGFADLREPPLRKPPIAEVTVRNDQPWPWLSFVNVHKQNAAAVECGGVLIDGLTFVDLRGGLEICDVND